MNPRPVIWLAIALAALVAWPVALAAQSVAESVPKPAELTEFTEPLAGWETELVKVGGTSIRGCIACEKCFENQDNECAVKKDIFNDIFAKMLKADAMILGSPVYFAAVSGSLKALIERAGYVAYANQHAFAGKNEVFDNPDGAVNGSPDAQREADYLAAAVANS